MAIKPLEVSISDLILAVEEASEASGRQIFEAELWKTLDNSTLLEIVDNIGSTRKISSLGIFLVVCRRKNFYVSRVDFLVALNSLRAEGLEDGVYYHLLRCVKSWKTNEVRSRGVSQFLRLAGGPEGEKKVLLGLRAVLRHLASRS